MLQVMLKDIEEMLGTPGFWLVTFVLNFFNLVLDILHVRLGGACFDVLLLIISFLLYFGIKSARSK